ncbi:MAG TPA: DKNYY domain-containing protein [Gammaproteobacteria bacterium]
MRIDKNKRGLTGIMSLRTAAVAIGAGVTVIACEYDPGYRIESDAVYYQYGTGEVEQVAGADPSTFEQLTYEYGRDKNGIYRLSGALPDAFIGQYNPGQPKPDPAGGTIYSGDRRGALVCDYRTYRDIGLNHQVDKHCAYEGDIRIPGADPQTLQPLTTILAKDKSRVYVFADVIQGADPETFEPHCKGSLVDGKDKTGRYWFEHRVPCDCAPHAGDDFAAPIAEVPPGMALLAETPPISIDLEALTDQPRFDSIFHQISAGYWRLSPGHHTIPLRCWNGDRSEPVTNECEVQGFLCKPGNVRKA